MEDYSWLTKPRQIYSELNSYLTQKSVASKMFSEPRYTKKAAPFFPNAFMVSECIYITKTTMTLKNCQNWRSKTLQLTGVPPCKIFGEKSGALEEE